jgi:hypothetical protein
MSYTLEEKLAWAREGVARWEGKLKQADVKAERAHEMGGGILGFGGSGNQRAAQQVRSAWGSADRAWREATEKLEYYTDKAKGYERRIAERDRQRLTRDDVAGATHVLISRSWRKVVRVNATTVSVDSGYSWVDRFKFDQVLAVRAVEATHSIHEQENK